MEFSLTSIIIASVKQGYVQGKQFKCYLAVTLGFCSLNHYTCITNKVVLYLPS